MISKLTNAETLDPLFPKQVVENNIEIPYGNFLLDADFSRNGQDLILSDSFDRQVTLDGYFSASPLPTLTNEFGAKIDGTLVSKLAGPGQIAQAGSTDASLGEAVGTIESLSGSATVQHANGVSEPLKQGSAIYKDDVIETAENTNMGLLMGDGSVMGIGSNSRMVIDEYAYNPDSGDGALGMSFLKGTMSFLSGKIAKNDYDDVDLKVPFGSIGIRGTEFIVEIYHSPQYRLYCCRLCAFILPENENNWMGKRISCLTHLCDARHRLAYLVNVFFVLFMIFMIHFMI